MQLQLSKSRNHLFYAVASLEFLRMSFAYVFWGRVASKHTVFLLGPWLHVIEKEAAEVHKQLSHTIVHCVVGVWGISGFWDGVCGLWSPNVEKLKFHAGTGWRTLLQKCSPPWYL